MRVADLRAAFGRTVGRARELAYRILDTVPPVRRTVDELVRVEIVDRAMVIGAQALLALLPLLIVLASFLPHEAIALAVDRFEDVLGITGGGHAAVQEGVSSVEGSGGTGIDAEAVRTDDRHHRHPDHAVLGDQLLAGDPADVRAGVAAQAPRWRRGPPSLPVLAVRLADRLPADRGRHLGGERSRHPLSSNRVWFLLAAALNSVIWWWSMRVLLFSRVPWRALAFPAAVTGTALTIYTGGSSIVMPTYVAAERPAVRDPGTGPGRGHLAGGLRRGHGRHRDGGPGRRGGPDDPLVRD